MWWWMACLRRVQYGASVLDGTRTNSIDGFFGVHVSKALSGQAGLVVASWIAEAGRMS